MRRFFNWLLILAAVGGVIAALTYPTMAWWRERNTPKFLTAQVTKGRVETVVNSSGTVKPVRTVSVGAFTSGPIKEVKVDFNTWITEREQVLALIDDKLQTANVKRDEAAVKSQKAEKERIKALLDQAEANEERAIKLRLKNEKFISDTEMDQFKYGVITLRAQFKLTEASIEQAEANLQNSKDQLGYTEIKGPKEIDFDTNTNPKTRVKGRVIDRKVDPGQTVAATFQTPELFTIALEMDRHMHVYAAVDEADIGMIRAGRDRNLDVTFTVDTYPGELFNGTIYAIRLNSTTTQNVVTYPVVIDAPNVFDKDRQELKLKPGMTANITFPIEAKENALRVPTSALRFTPAPAQVHPDDRHYLEAITTSQAIITGKRSADEKAELAKGRQRRIVWVQEDKWLRAVPVVLGLMEHQHAEIVRGDLTEGQAVVTGMEGNVAPR